MSSWNSEGVSFGHRNIKELDRLNGMIFMKLIEIGKIDDAEKVGNDRDDSKRYETDYEREIGMKWDVIGIMWEYVSGVENWIEES